MHGVRRELNVAEDLLNQRRREQEEQLSQWRQALADLSSVLHPDRTHTHAELMEATAKVCLINPDYYQAWNVRKRAILAYGIDRLDWKGELEFSVDSIKGNPKSYHAWYHRKWLLSNSFPLRGDEGEEEGLRFDPTRELHLCQLLLDLDKRNFHCWNYRKWLAEHFSVPVADEFDYTGRKIFQNFSNYSAWHRRSQLMPETFKDPAELSAAIQADLRLVRNAYYTEPADQAPWFYLKWLLTSTTTNATTIREEISNITQLLSIEPDATLANLCLGNLKKMIGEREGLDELTEHLCSIDPVRSALYKKLFLYQDN